MNDTQTTTSSSSSYTDYSFSYSLSSWPTSQIDVSKDVDEPGGPDNHPNCYHFHRRRFHPIPLHPSLCDQGRRNSRRKRDLLKPLNLNDLPELAEEPNIAATESTSTTRSSALPQSLTTLTPSTTTAATTEGTTTTTSIESSPASSVTIIPVRTPPPTPTEEDKIIFDNLNDLLFELLITIYHEHLRLRHYTRR